jgi:hypothetical protein
MQFPPLNFVTYVAQAHEASIVVGRRLYVLAKCDGWVPAVYSIDLTVIIVSMNILK